MYISDVKLPDNPSLTIQPSSFSEHPHFAILVATIVASWAETEARLDSVFLSLFRDEAKLAEFRDVKGWDARVKYMDDALKGSLGALPAARVRSIMSVVGKAARKRHEVAHGFWGLCEEVPGAMVLFTGETYTHLTRMTLKAEEAGSAEIELNAHDFIPTARIIEEKHLKAAWDECEESRGLLQTFWIEELPDIVKTITDIPTAKAAEHADVAERLKNAEAGIKRAEKAEARKNHS